MKGGEEEQEGGVEETGGEEVVRTDSLWTYEDFLKIIKHVK